MQHDTTCLFPVSDWETLNWAKMAALIDNSTQFTYGMGLVPWYLPGYILPAGKAATLVCTMQICSPLHTQHCTLYAYFLHTRKYCMPLQHKLRAGVKARHYSASEICIYNANESCTRNSSFPVVGISNRHESVLKQTVQPAACVLLHVVNSVDACQHAMPN